MSLTEIIERKVREMSPEDQHRVLEFVDTIALRDAQTPRRPLKGSLSHLATRVGSLKDDVDELRAEIWDDSAVRSS